jgi:hypothetical protein
MSPGRTSLAKAIALTLAVALLSLAQGSVAAAAQLPGWTLTYKQTSNRKVSRTIAARTRQGKIVLLGLGHPRSYVQYDGKVLWACAQGKKCVAALRGAKAKTTAEFLEDEFFYPYGRHGLATAFMTDPKPAGRRTVAGVASTCKTSPDALGHGPPDLLCTADRGGFLTLLEAGGETYSLQHAVAGVESSFLVLPSGTWNGQI